MSHYIIQTASAKMPSSCRSPYRRVAVLEVAEGVERASMISDRASDVIRVVATWERLNVGTTQRSAYARALRDAEKMVDELYQQESLARCPARPCSVHEDCCNVRGMGAACITESSLEKCRREGRERDVLKAALDWHTAVVNAGSDRLVPLEEAALLTAARALG
jgi:hypothetical protein